MKKNITEEIFNKSYMKLVLIKIKQIIYKLNLKFFFIYFMSLQI
jgi:hypothetical protein